jgi:ATP-dependent protease ClpP protease subunit
MNNEVLISGVIGNTYNPDGSVKTKGVELVDVVEQVVDLGDVDEITFVINSPGGNVNVGLDIRDFIASVPNAKTHAAEMCASIATVIHTAVPLQNRFIEEGTKYMIHNPWIELSGDAATLSQVAKDMEEIEKNLESHYSKATGSTKETISAFMSSEMWLSNDQCIKLGFASQIIPKASLRAVAIFQTTNVNNMSTTQKSRLATAMAAIGAKFGLTEPAPNASIDIKALVQAGIAAGRSAVAVMIETDNGTIETPFADVMVGDPVMIEGAPAANGDYTISNGEFVSLEGGMIVTGDVITVTDGVISAIVSNGAASDAENLAQLQAKLEAAEAKAAAAEAKAAQLETENEAAAAQLETLAKMGSKAAMPTAQAAFRGTPAAPAAVTRTAMAERKAAYKK